MKRIFKDYFTFSKKERMAVIILLLLIGGFIAAPYGYVVKHEAPVLNKALIDFMANTQGASKDSRDDYVPPSNNYAEKKILTKPILFPFDPNTIGEDGWVRLGVHPKTIHTIMNYRNKGGHFRLPEDIRKIWGLRKEEANRLIPFVKIEMPAKAVSYHSPTNTEAKVLAGIAQMPKQIISFDINTATADIWKSLPGIGDVLANRIVKFRDKIGGFISIDQVKKTYGVSDSVFQLIRPFLLMEPSNLPKLNLNTVSAYDLKLRVNLSYEMAKAIIAYRQQKGPYQSIQDLKNITGIPDTVFQKLILHVKIE